MAAKLRWLLVRLSKKRSADLMRGLAEGGGDSTTGLPLPLKQADCDTELKPARLPVPSQSILSPYRQVMIKY